jgi:hypothetical protein
MMRLIVVRGVSRGGSDVNTAQPEAVLLMKFESGEEII